MQVKMSINEMENEIMGAANAIRIAKYHDEKDLKTCIMEAIFEVTRLSEYQFCGFMKSTLGYEIDFNAYVNFLYEKMIKYGAKV